MKHPAEDPVSTPTGHPPIAGALVGILVSLSTIVIHLVPGASEAFQWERHGGASPLSWLTSHLAHWSWDHLLWDLAAFAILSVAALRLIPRRFLPCLLLAALLITLEIRLNQPGLATYRGLSGIDSALFALVLAGLWKTGDRWASWPRLFAVAAGLAFVAKTSFELATGTTVFVTTQPSVFIPATSAHLVGFASGILAGTVFGGSSRPRTPRPGRAPLPLSPGEVPARDHA